MRLVKFKHRRHKAKSRRHGFMHNPRKSHGKRRHAKRYRHNPASLKQIMKPQNFIDIALVTAGLVGGAKVQKMIFDTELFTTGSLKSVRSFAGLLSFIAGTAVTLSVRNNAVKKLGVGIAAAGIYDLVASNVSMLGLKPLAGDTITMGKDYLVGDTISVAGDMTELVGDEEQHDSVYA